MKYFICIVVAIFGAQSALAHNCAGHDKPAKAAKTEKTAWGEEIQMAKAVTLDEALKSFEGEEQTVLVRGKVDKVCKMKGCWMVMQDSKKQDVRITFAKYAFFVPYSVLGKDMEVQGKIEHKEVSVAEQKHYLKDEGADKAAIDAVKEPKKVFSMVATGVRLVQ